jgi:sugar lactone lactonase YvrE
MFRELAQPFTQEEFAGGFAHNGKWGPIGIVFLPNGEVLVADDADGNIYRFPPAGGAVKDPWATGVNCLGLAFSNDGRLFASRETQGDVVELDPESGEIVGTIDSGLKGPVGIARDPISGHIFFAIYEGNSIRCFDPGSNSLSIFASGEPLNLPDAVVFDEAGTLWVTNLGDRSLLRFDREGKGTRMCQFPQPGDGACIGRQRTPMEDRVLVSRHDGMLSLVDIHQDPAAVVEVAWGGSQGDFITVDPQGYAYVTQTDSVMKIGPPYFLPTSGAFC